MQNLIAGKSANSINLEETANYLTGHVATPNSGENFNKIFQKATNKQEELTKKNTDPKAGKKTFGHTTKVMEEPVQTSKKDTRQLSKSKNGEVKIENNNSTKDISSDKTDAQQTAETELASDEIPLKELEGELIKLSNLLLPNNAADIAQPQEVNEELAKILDEIKQSDTGISKELVQKINDLINKCSNSITDVSAINESAELDESVKAVVENIQDILKNKNEKTTPDIKTQTAKIGAGVEEKTTPQNQLSGLFVDEKNIQTPDGKIAAPIQEKQEISMEKILEKEILEELNVEVEQVIISPTQQQESILKNASSATEQVIKLAIEKVSPTLETNSSNQSQQNGHGMNAQAQANTNQTNAAQGTTVPKFTDVQKTDIMNQIGAKFEQLKDGSNARITLALRPNDLGRIVIELSQSKEGVTTSILAQNQDVKEMLEKNIEGLKQQLAQAGVNVQNIQVKSVENESREQQGNFKDFKDEQQGENRNENSNSNTGKNQQNSEQSGNTEEEFGQNYINYDQKGLISHN